MHFSETKKIILSLSELSHLVKETLYSAFPEYIWVTAEIARITYSTAGHCYLDLIEKREETILSTIRANIWANQTGLIFSRFNLATGEKPKQGMKILILASVDYHARYGISLTIQDIDPGYTLGDMARKRLEIINRLDKEGLLDKNKTLIFPMIPHRIAIISSATAAGYGDFVKHLQENPLKYTFVTTLFNSSMQGDKAPAEIVNQLKKISKKKNQFDVIVVLRGGGSNADLNCFDNYLIGRAIGSMPLPVLTGIGHERDETITDMCAHTRLKTPTAVAQYLISCFENFEKHLDELMQNISILSRNSILQQRNKFTEVMHRLSILTKDKFSEKREQIQLCNYHLKFYPQKLLDNYKMKLLNVENSIKLVSPQTILKRGYSITLNRGKILKDIRDLAIDNSIETILYKGKISSKIQFFEDGNNEG